MANTRQDLTRDPMIQKFCRTIAVIMLAAFTSVAAEPYLPFVGPPPLRFARPELSTATSSNNATADLLKIPAPADNKTQDRSNNVPVTAAVAATNNTSSTTGAGPESPSQSYLAGGSSPNVLMIPTDDLTAINPGMLVDYFKPVGGRTNGVTIFTPAKIGFIPPVPSSTRSRATYTTK